MIFIINFKQLDTKTMKRGKYSLYLNEVRKNLAASANCSCRRLKAPTFGALPSERRIAGTPAAPSL
jgi:hypothetical protein